VTTQSSGPSFKGDLPEETNRSGCLSSLAIILFVPAFLVTAIGVLRGGIPTPGKTQPAGPVRQSYATDEAKWRYLKAQERNDSALWNEHARAVFEYPRDQWMEKQDEMVKGGHMPEASRLRALTTSEQAEMSECVAAAKERNSFRSYAMAWTLFGVPLCVLATLFGVLAFVQAATGSVRGSRLAMFGILVVLNIISLLLTWWNAKGTSLD